MKFSIVTPSFRGSEWLKLCIASVADQQDVEAEHIVQDAESDDGTLDWLPQDRRVRAFIEKDGGMYDAVNRGFRRATGDVLAYLNCDEQYLPGALAAVAGYFDAHPEVDVALADFIVTDPAGEYVCSRYSLTPIAASVWVRFNVPTCAMFLRRRVIADHQLFFDTRWRAHGDLHWILEACRRGLRFGELRRFTSVFAETGSNLGLLAISLGEREERERMAPRWVPFAAPAFIFLHRARMFLRGAFSQPPFSYAAYTRQSPENRVTFDVRKPTGIWRRPQ